MSTGSKASEEILDALFEEIEKVFSPDWLNYSNEDWQVVTKVFNLHFHLENVINLLITIYFLRKAEGGKSKVFSEVILEKVDFLKKLEMIRRLGWIDGGGYSVAQELNNYRRDFAHPKRDLTQKLLKKFRKTNFYEKYKEVMVKLIKLVVLEDSTYKKRLNSLISKLQN